jgi:hypothetical protein
LSCRKQDRADEKSNFQYLTPGPQNSSGESSAAFLRDLGRPALLILAFIADTTVRRRLGFTSSGAAPAAASSGKAGNSAGSAS